MTSLCVFLWDCEPGFEKVAANVRTVPRNGGNAAAVLRSVGSVYIAAAVPVLPYKTSYKRRSYLHHVLLAIRVVSTTFFSWSANSRYFHQLATTPTTLACLERPSAFGVWSSKTALVSPVASGFPRIRCKSFVFSSSSNYYTRMTNHGPLHVACVGVTVL